MSLPGLRRYHQGSSICSTSVEQTSTEAAISTSLHRGVRSSAQALLRNFAAGEARLDVADAALQIGAEDDALVSHSPVALPVCSPVPITGANHEAFLHCFPWSVSIL